VKPWLAACELLRAKPHVLRCVPDCWRFASTPRKASRLMLMVPACSRWRMGRTNMLICEKCSIAARSTHTRLWKCSTPERV
jgi:hypothetical protein